MGPTKTTRKATPEEVEAFERTLREMAALGRTLTTDVDEAPEPRRRL
jgi:hypothetical protein